MYNSALVRSTADLHARAVWRKSIAQMNADESPPPAPSTSQRLKDWLAGIRPADVAGYLLSLDGIVLGLIGAYAAINALWAFQGEGFLLFVGGVGLILFGVMIVRRWNLAAVRIGLVGITAGYFATALSEFEVATDPCDIGSTLERCAGHVAGGHPWVVYQGPLLLAALGFFFMVLEPLAARRR